MPAIANLDNIVVVSRTFDDHLTGEGTRENSHHGPYHKSGKE